VTMQLSEFQKQIVGTILTGETCHIETFFHMFCSFQSVNYPHSSWGSYGNRTAKPEIGNLTYVVKNPKEVIGQLSQFIAVWNQLKNSNLVISIPCHRYYLHPIYWEQTSSNYQTENNVLELFNAFDREEIVPLPALEEFVKAGYKTREEIKQEEERDFLLSEMSDRKGSQKLTKRIAYISIAASIVSVVVSGVFNYLTYKTDRTVTITNAKAFPDTTRVYLVNPPANPIDTTQAKKLGGGKK